MHAVAPPGTVDLRYHFLLSDASRCLSASTIAAFIDIILFGIYGALLEILTKYNVCEVRIADAHRISIENSKFLGGVSVNLLDVSIFHWLISMVHLYLQSLLLARISALRLNFAVTEGLHFY